jgi:hypothetical protein
MIAMEVINANLDRDNPCISLEEDCLNVK